MQTVDLTTLEGRLRWWAKEKFGGLRGLSRATGVHHVTLGNYDDDHPPSGEVLLKLIGVGMDAHWLLVGQSSVWTVGDDAAAALQRIYELNAEANERIATAIKLAGPFIKPTLNDDGFTTDTGGAANEEEE